MFGLIRGGSLAFVLWVAMPASGAHASECYPCWADLCGHGAGLSVLVARVDSLDNDVVTLKVETITGELANSDFPSKVEWHSPGMALALGERLLFPISKSWKAGLGYPRPYRVVPGHDVLMGGVCGRDLTVDDATSMITAKDCWAEAENRYPNDGCGEGTGCATVPADASTFAVLGALALLVTGSHFRRANQRATVRQQRRKPLARSETQ